jgi:queuine/archaeosine tRNA-ribosyltransferase
VHNLHFIQDLMGRIRKAVLDGDFGSFQAEFRASYQTTDEETRVSQKQKWLESRNRRQSR